MSWRVPPSLAVGRSLARAHRQLRYRREEGEFRRGSLQEFRGAGRRGLPSGDRLRSQIRPGQVHRVHHPLLRVTTTDSLLPWAEPSSSGLRTIRPKIFGVPSRSETIRGWPATAFVHAPACLWRAGAPGAREQRLRTTCRLSERVLRGDVRAYNRHPDPDCSWRANRDRLCCVSWVACLSSPSLGVCSSL